MALDLSKLNKEQREAVVHGQGPLLIVAGAGTGKTTVITQRLVYLVEKGLAKPEEILAVTFTDKAANEMEERVDRLLPYGYVDLWISTFHSFSERVLRDNALDIGLPSDFKILDETAAWLLVYRNLEKFKLNYYKPLGNPTKFIQAMISHFSHCKDEAIYPEDYLSYVDRLKTNLTELPEKEEIERLKEVSEAFHLYQQLLLENSALDFGDLINFTLRLFKKRPQILKRYREKFKYILVDEFQDTNWAQYELVKVLAAPKNNLTVCADDDQMIYLWRSASFNNIIQFGKDFPNAKKVSLIRNYRSPQNILDKAYRFIKANDPDRLECVNNINKHLVSQKREKGIIEHLHARTSEEEVEMVIKKIVDILREDKEAGYSDFAILVRANNAALPFVKGLEKAGLPYQFLASRGLYTRPLILDIISYFKVLNNYYESSPVFRILNLPFLKISYEDIVKLTGYASQKTKSLFEAMEELSLIPGISKRGQEKILFILSLIKKHSNLARQKPVSELLAAFLEDSGYLRYLAQRDNRQEIGLLNQFYRRVKDFEESAIEPTLNNFITELDMEIESGEAGKIVFDPEEGPDVIKVMTIHSAKGLEFKYVFLVNMVDKRFPSIERKDPIELPDDLRKDIKPSGDAHLQEERRLCYVAMTRAKKGLYFTSAENYGGMRKKRLSRFLIEMGYGEKNHLSEDRIEIKNQKFDRTKERESGLLVRNRLKKEYLPPHFSYSQLAAFEKCPLQYKLAFVLKIPRRGRAVYSFGKTIHKTLYDFLREITIKGRQKDLFGLKAGNLPEKKDNSCEFKHLLEIYKRNWIDRWYESKGQKDEYYRLGKKIIKNFYDSYCKENPEILSVNGTPALEIPFSLKLQGNIIKGQIDRIDKVGEEVVIIDYKTGNPKKKLAREDKEQLLIYQLAVEEVFKMKPRALVYYYLNEGSKISFLADEKEKNEMKEKIVKEIEEIKNSDFEARPGRHCAFCDFRDICEKAQNYV